MSTQATPLASYRGTDSALQRRVWSLALGFQELLTAIVRLRFGRQAVNNAEMFRAHMREGLKAAAQDAMNRGHSNEDIQLAMFAVVAFLDESVLNCRQPAFADWPRMPLQEELFGGHVAGETFFQNIQRILGRTDWTQAADVLELYYLCLLLGYKGRYGAGGAGELRGIMDTIKDKLQRVRGSSTVLCPRAALPSEPVRPAQTDPWIRRLTVGAIGCLVLAAALFAGFKLVLGSAASDIHTMATQTRN